MSNGKPVRAYVPIEAPPGVQTTGMVWVTLNPGDAGYAEWAAWHDLQDPAGTQVNLAASAEFSGDAGYTTVPTVSSQDGARLTTNSLLSKAPVSKLRAAIKKRRKKGVGGKK